MVVEKVPLPNPVTHYINNIPFTQQMFDNLIFMHVEQRYKFPTIQKLIFLSHGVKIEAFDFIEAISVSGYNWSLQSKEFTVISVDGVDLTQRMLDNIVFMRHNRKYDWMTIGKMFYITFQISISFRVIGEVLRMHDYSVNGPEFRYKNPMNPSVARVPDSYYTFRNRDEEISAYAKYGSWNKEMKSVSNSITGKMEYLSYVPIMRYNFGKYIPGGR
jgi:hypothetical protein